MDFREVMEIKFGHKKLVELLRMINDEEVSAANAKQIMMMIIDGDEREPKTIAVTLGFVGQVQTSEELKLACEQVISENADVVHKIIKTGRPGPAMHLVGKVMKLTERKGDPVIIKALIEDIIKQKASKVTHEDKHEE
jgi:Asp-tRNA(Asn)/Glu-tRNA(Gln) amidotransferase B subunit